MFNPKAKEKGQGPVYRELAGSTVQRKLAAISLLFEYLCKETAVLRLAQRLTLL